MKTEFEKKYTPGPWHVEHRDGYETPDIFDNLGNLILFGPSIEDGRGKPSIILASSAPELLEALEAIVDYFDNELMEYSSLGIITDAKQAIRKAYGK